jgi:hypothetical protein
MMKGIMFSKGQIPAVLDGSKTMTRRVMKRQLAWEVRSPSIKMVDGVARFFTEGKLCTTPFWKPRYAVGETVYLKEAWRAEEVEEYDGLDGIRYKADNCFIGIPPNREAAEAWLKVYDGDHPDRWKSPIYLPEWAARAKLKITAVRAERVQDITEEDAVKEGCPNRLCGTDIIHEKIALRGFQLLWESIHGPGSWERNEWCWVYEFRRAQ